MAARPGGGVRPCSILPPSCTRAARTGPRQPGVPAPPGAPRRPDGPGVRCWRSASRLAVACAPAPPPPPVTAPGPTPAPNPPSTPSPAASSGCSSPAPHAGDLCWQDQWWTVKASDTPIGPGPNTFASANVSVRADGLHLSVRPRKGRWTAAELISETRFGYGTYRWTLRLPALDPNVVFGLFTWEDDPAYNHREIDFEAARWGMAADPTNSQFVVQPYASPGNLQRITTPSGAQTVGFTWRPDEVAFTAGGQLVDLQGRLDPPAAGERPHEPLARRRTAPQRRQAGRRRRERLHLHAVTLGGALRRRPRPGSP